MTLLSSLPIQSKVSLIFHFALLNLKIRFRNTYLGFLWAVLEPLLHFIVLYIVFTAIRIRDENFAIYLLTGIIVYSIFVRGTAGGLGSITSNAGILKSLRIEKEFFPIVATTAAGILAIFTVGVFFGLMPVFQFIPQLTIILLPIIIILTLFLILGLSYLLSIIHVFVRDIQIIWTIFSYSLLFISPIFWKLDNVDGILLQIQQINPLGQLIELGHKLVIDGNIPPFFDWLYTTLFIVGIFLVGYFIFHKFEDRITEEI